MNKQAPLPVSHLRAKKRAAELQIAANTDADGRRGWGGGGTRVVDVKPFSGFAFNKVAVDDVLHHMVAALQKNGAS